VDVSPANPQVRLLDMISDLRTGAKEIGVTSDRSRPGFELRLRIRQANEELDNTSTNRLDLTGCSRNTEKASVGSIQPRTTAETASGFPKHVDLELSASDGLMMIPSASS
jgi:hypothetical protein